MRSLKSCKMSSKKNRTSSCTENYSDLTEFQKFGPQRLTENECRNISGRDLEIFYQIAILHDQAVSCDNLQLDTLTFFDVFILEETPF